MADLEARLRQQLREECRAAPISPGAWERIRDRAARGPRAARRWWVGVATAAALGGLAAAAVLSRPPAREALGPGGEPYFAGFWPVHTLRDAREVQRRVDAGAEPWRRDATAVAERFAREYLGWELGERIEGPEVAESPEEPTPEGRTAEVALMAPGGLATHTVELAGLPGVARPAWFVTGVRSPDVEVDVPSPGEPVSSPLRLSGRASVPGGELRARLLEDGGRVLASATVRVAGGSFSASLSFDRPRTAGGVLELTGEGEDGHNWTVLRLRFAGGEAVLPSGWTWCTNRAEGFAIARPAAWHALGEECGLFDPEYSSLPEGEELPAYGLAAHQEAHGFDFLVSEEGLAQPQNTLSRREVRLDGRRAVILELNNWYSRRYLYVVEREGFGFVVETLVSPDRMDRYAEFRAVVDRAVRTLQFLPRREQPQSAWEADLALRCFLRAGTSGDPKLAQALAQSCTTPQLADRLGNSLRTPAVARFTIRADLNRTDGLLEVLVRRYLGEDGRLTGWADDRVRVRRWDRQWLVSDWRPGTVTPVSGTVEVTVFLATSPRGCGPKDLAPVTRTVPRGEDALRLALEELFTGTQEEKGGLFDPFPLDARLLGVRRAADGTVQVRVNEAAMRPAGPCTPEARQAAIERTVGAQGARVQVQVG